MRKVDETVSFDAKVAPVASQTARELCRFWDSWATCMPKASEKASAIAMLSTPPITTIRDWVPAWSPTMRPSVVMIPEVRPNPTPVLNESRKATVSACPSVPRGRGGATAGLAMG